jgi:alkylation response protein AidB-like acyl-CoA dehydrogenase
VLGREGEAMKIMMGTLEDRIQISARCLGAADLALRLTSTTFASARCRDR